MAEPNPSEHVTGDTAELAVSDLRAGAAATANKDLLFRLASMAVSFSIYLQKAADLFGGKSVGLFAFRQRDHFYKMRLHQAAGNRLRRSPTRFVAI